MIRKSFFMIAILAATIAILIACGGRPGPDLSSSDLSWNYFKGPSGKCYEVGTHGRWGGFSFTVNGQVDDYYCK